MKPPTIFLCCWSLWWWVLPCIIWQGLTLGFGESVWDIPIFIIFISLLRNTEYTCSCFYCIHWLLMEKILHHSGCTKRWLYLSNDQFSHPPEWCRIFSSIVPLPYNTWIFSSILFRLFEVFNFMEKYGMPDRPKTPECLVIGVRWWIVLRFIQERFQCQPILVGVFLNRWKGNPRQNAEVKMQ